MIKGDSFRSHLELFPSDDLYKTKYFEVISVKASDDNFVIMIAQMIRGASLYAKTEEKWGQIPLLFKVLGGGWYGDKGRWSLHNKEWVDIVFEKVTNLIDETFEGDECLTVKDGLSQKSKNAVLISAGKKYSFRFVTMSHKTNTIFGYDLDTNNWLPLKELYELRKEFLLSLHD